MKLLKPVYFRDGAGRTWQAPAGAWLDGASIPRFFWRVVGSPYSGRYRAASVVHDYYCNVQTRPSPEVHHVFWEMCLASGVGRWSAFWLWLAVRMFGPRFGGRTDGSD